jgi:predicted enzyme related to lactoylglutathione lyase
MPTPIVFFDIAGTDTDSLATFYAAVFDWTRNERSELTVPAGPMLTGAVREDPTEMRLYLGVADVAATLEQVVAHGGSVDAERFEVPGVVVLGLFRDPAGNPLGLVEMDGDAPVVP